MVNIRSLIPHRGDILLPRTILNLRPDHAIRASHLVEESEPCFSQTTDRRAAWPRTLLVELIGQAAAALCASSSKCVAPPEAVPLLASVKNVTFGEDAHIGDLIIAEAVMDQIIGPAVFVSGRATVGERELCHVSQAIVVYAIPNKNNPINTQEKS